MNRTYTSFLKIKLIVRVLTDLFVFFLRLGKLCMTLTALEARYLSNLDDKKTISKSSWKVRNNEEGGD